MSSSLVRAGVGCVAVVLGCSHPAPASPPSGRPPGALVAYASGYGPDIDLFAVDDTTGALSLRASTPSFGKSPSFLAVNGAATNLYALDETSAGRVGAYAIDASTGALTFLNDVSSGGDGPAHLALDSREGRRFVFVANYGDGTVSVLPILAGGRLGPAVQTLTVGAQAHEVVVDPSSRYVFVPCKGADYVAQFLFDGGTGKLSPNAVPTVPTAHGAGPRHLVFHPNQRFAYLVNELDNTLTGMAFDDTTGRLTELQTLSTLPAGFSGKDTAAEVWVHPTGEWLFGSNRGDDSIVVFALNPSTGAMIYNGHTKTAGKTPRDFALDPKGSFLYVANQGSGQVVPFRFDARRGTLTPAAQPVPVAGASFVGLVHLP